MHDINSRKLRANVLPAARALFWSGLITILLDIFYVGNRYGIVDNGVFTYWSRTYPSLFFFAVLLCFLGGVLKYAGCKGWRRVTFVLGVLTAWFITLFLNHCFFRSSFVALHIHRWSSSLGYILIFTASLYAYWQLSRACITKVAKENGIQYQPYWRFSPHRGLTLVGGILCVLTTYINFALDSNVM